MQVQRVSMTLAAVAQDGDFITVQQTQVCVFVVVNIGQCPFSSFSYAWRGQETGHNQVNCSMFTVH
jgi:hypothetical protein